MADKPQKQEVSMAEQITALAYGMNKILARLDQLEAGQAELSQSITCNWFSIYLKKQRQKTTDTKSSSSK